MYVRASEAALVTQIDEVVGRLVAERSGRNGGAELALIPTPLVNGEALEGLKETTLNGVRDLVHAAQIPAESETPPSVVVASPVADRLNLMLKLSETKSWLDYATKYWTSNPAGQQY
ncbi:hypothetical protein PybrP1_008927 [[Pythium] brassicae (nom. inval.)]|nr:hypothetical protein PybrP1_008927 [[Pythium] brassicae (nom. inval.)]